MANCYFELSQPNSEINFIGLTNSYTYKVPTHHVCYGQIQGVCLSGGVIYNPVKL